MKIIITDDIKVYMVKSKAVKDITDSNRWTVRNNVNNKTKELQTGFKKNYTEKATRGTRMIRVKSVSEIPYKIDKRRNEIVYHDKWHKKMDKTLG